MNKHEMQKPIHNNTLLSLMCTILYISISTTNGSASPMTMFTPPSHFFLQHRSLTLQRATHFDYRNSHHKSSMKESVLTNEMNGHKRSNAKTMSKIKSSANSYNQFYKEGILVGIERTSSNSRRISGEIIMDIPTDDIWNILTDYDNLSSHVPNLVESKVINNGGRIVGGKPRVYQRGAQSIFGFEFGADVTMDMTEVVHHEQYDNEHKVYSIDFECVDSQFFSQFDGSWILEEYSNDKTMVRYIVDVRPKGPVPVAALEWRIKEDVPVNILAVSKSARASGAERREEELNTLAHQEVESTPRTEQQQSMNRVEQSPPQPQSNPLRRLTVQATRKLKQTVKSFIPTPVFSTAKRAIKAMNNANPMAGTRRSWQNVGPSMSLNAVRRKRNRLKSTIVDW